MTVKPGLLSLLLLTACSESDISYDYELTWTCRSAEGCERTDAVLLVNRLNVSGDELFFLSTRTTEFVWGGQRVASDALPAGCALMYGSYFFGHELEPSQICDTEEGMELELSIPNAIPTTSSDWLVEARDLGPW
jgi:hypothetical protein